MQTTAPTQSEIADALLRIATQNYRHGPVMAQESAVLREAAEELNARNDVRLQQKILNCWHMLFQSGKLIWGYDIGNPGHPFYHFPEWMDHEGLPSWKDDTDSNSDE